MFEKKNTYEVPNDPTILEQMRSLYPKENIVLNVTTVAEWFREWHGNHTIHLGKSTRYTYSVSINCHIIRVLGHLRLDELSFEDCQLFVNSLMVGCGLSAPLQPKTIHNYFGVLHVGLETAKKMGLITSNPADGVMLPAIPQYAYHPLNQEQLKALYKRLKNHPKRDLFLFTLYTGLRQGEIIGLTWSALDLPNQTMNIYRQIQYNKDTNEYYWCDPKGGRTRVLALNRHAMDILIRLDAQMRHDPDDFVFPSRVGTHLTPPAVYDSFKKVISSIGCEKVRFHDLRHTYAVMSLQAGMDPKTLQYNLGHFSAAFTLDVYCHCIDEMKRKAAERLDVFFDNLFDSI